MYLLLSRLLSLVNDIGKSYIVWQEIFDNGLKIRQDTVVDVWKGGWQDEMSKITKAGYNVILSNPWYLSSISYGSDWIPVSVCVRDGFSVCIIIIICFTPFTRGIKQIHMTLKVEGMGWK